MRYPNLEKVLRKPLIALIIVLAILSVFVFILIEKNDSEKNQSEALPASQNLKSISERHFELTDNFFKNIRNRYDTKSFIASSSDIKLKDNAVLFDAAFGNNKIQLLSEKQNGDLNIRLIVKTGDKIIFDEATDLIMASGRVETLEFENKTLVLIRSFTGGAHCCDQALPIFIDNSEVKVGKIYELGNSGTMPSLNQAFIDGGKLRLAGYDDRFAYFNNISYAESGIMNYTVILEFDFYEGKIIDASSNYTEDYKTLYSDSKKLTEEFKQTSQFKPDEWLAPLIFNYTVGSMAGEKEEGLNTDFKAGFDYFIAKDNNSELKKQNKTADTILEKINSKLCENHIGNSALPFERCKSYSSRINKYGAKILLIGGTGSRQIQKEVWNLEDQEYLTPEDEWVPTLLNSPADLLRATCREGYNLTACEGGKIEENGDIDFCFRAVNKEVQNVITIECERQRQ